jgi:hypothetical protein
LPEELNLACITPFPEVETAIHLKPDDKNGSCRTWVLIEEMKRKSQN